MKKSLLRAVAFVAALALGMSMASAVGVDALLNAPHQTAGGVIYFGPPTSPLVVARPGNCSVGQYVSGVDPTSGLPTCQSGVTSGHGFGYLDGNNTYSGAAIVTGSLALPTLSSTDNSTGAANTANIESKLAALTRYLDSNFGSTVGLVLCRNSSAWQGISPNSNSNWVLASNGTGACPSYKAPTALGAVAPTIQRFTSGSGTYTTSAGVTWIKVKACGGGAGGGSSGSSSTTGSAGGNTTFGTSLITTNGGSGGSGGGGTATAAAPAVTLIAQAGGSGGGAGNTGSSTTYAMGGSGGASPLGGQGVGGGANQSGQSAATNSCSGGGGAGTGNGTSQTGGAGGSAGGFVEAIISSPSATYSYSVGASGAGASGGGAGGAGLIIVEEHYGS